MLHKLVILIANVLFVLVCTGIVHDFVRVQGCTCHKCRHLQKCLGGTCTCALWLSTHGKRSFRFFVLSINTTPLHIRFRIESGHRYHHDELHVLWIGFFRDVLGALPLLSQVCCSSCAVYKYQTAAKKLGAFVRDLAELEGMPLELIFQDEVDAF